MFVSYFVVLDRMICMSRCEENKNEFMNILGIVS